MFVCSRVDSLLRIVRGTLLPDQSNRYLQRSLCSLHSLHNPRMYRGVPAKPNPVKDLNKIDLPLVSEPRP